MTFTFGSLFAGIGGIDLGLERAGMTCEWQVEKDEYAQKVLAKHWSDVARFRDVRDCGSGNLGAVDLITGGFPCQDVSAAGRGAGLEGERSGLWREFARIIRELRPCYVLVENVPMLLHRGIDRVLGDLAACGYDAEWQCLPAAAFGAPHRRDRVFIVAYTNRNRREWWQYKQEQEPRGRHSAESRPNGEWEPMAYAPVKGGGELSIQSGTERQEGSDTDRSGQSNVSDAHSQRLDRRQNIFQATIQTGRLFAKGNHPWAIEPGICGVAHGVSNRVHRLRGLGNAVVPQVAEFIGRLILEHAGYDQQQQRKAA